MTRAVTVELPWPPSVNHYWGTRGKARFIGAAGKAFRAAVLAAWYQARAQGFGTARLSVTLLAHAPDRRKRDLDNILKATLDALCHARVFEDDAQIDVLDVRRRKPEKPGRVVVTVAEA